MADSLLDKPPVNRPVMIATVVVAVAALAAWFYWRGHHAPLPPLPASTSAAPAEPEENVAHPLPKGRSDASQAPLPELADSDKAVGDALAEAGGSAVTQYLVPDSVIRHLVVTVDNLPRQKVAMEKRPVGPVPGTFVVDGDELQSKLDSHNFQRYEPLVDVLRKVDMQRLAAVYLRFYPLFQKAYQDLGYPNGYFNDRLVSVIDVLLETPQTTGAISLVRPNVMYQFADPTLESRPAGQKILIRMGPDNAAAVKAKLKELRALITAVPTKH